MLDLLTQSALDALNNPIGLTDLDGSILRCNQSYRDCYGINAKDFLGSTAINYLPRRDVQVHMNADLQISSRQKEECSYKALLCKFSDQIVTHRKFKALDFNNKLIGIFHIVENRLIEDLIAPDSHKSPLTPRENLVLQQITRGASQKTIAANLGISPYTVNDHLKAIYSKLGINSRAQAQIIAMGVSSNKAPTCKCEKRDCKSRISIVNNY